MLVDLNIEGKRILIIGAGREALRKAIGLAGQGAEIIAVSSKFQEGFREWEKQGEMRLIAKTASNGKIVNDFLPLYMVMAMTDDRKLNRKIVNEAKKSVRFVYSVDDREYSDFSHPAVIDTKAPIRMAVSTSGESPLMAKRLRERAEAMADLLVRDEDYLHIQLQKKMREIAKKSLRTPELRKSSLLQIFEDPEIDDLLKQNQFEKAEILALEQLNSFGG